MYRIYIALYMVSKPVLTRFISNEARFKVLQSVKNTRNSLILIQVAWEFVLLSHTCNVWPMCTAHLNLFTAALPVSWSQLIANRNFAVAQDIGACCAGWNTYKARSVVSTTCIVTKMSLDMPHVWHTYTWIFISIVKQGKSRLWKQLQYYCYT